ncbi:MAG: ATP-binding cassette domain-containing protein [Pseudomonadota bacterium]|nr:ATP-binding cassette domain-containing protein [Pseudomonadota bacterium]
MSDVRPKITVRGLNKSFGANNILKDINLDIAIGESMALIGGSGAGKSVLLKNIIGIICPDAGSIQIDGEDIVGLGHGHRDRINRKFGVLFQGAALFDSLTLWENVAFGLIAGKGLRRAEAREIALNKLRQVGLSVHVADRHPAEISAGAQKRVGLARAIATEPEILFFDEPTTGIDPLMGDVIDRLIIQCVKELGATALTITHDLHSARRIGDRIAMIQDGRIIWVDDAVKIDNSGNSTVDNFINGRSPGGLSSLTPKKEYL